MYLKDERSLVSILEFEDLCVGDGFEMYDEHCTPYLKVSETHAFNLEDEQLEKIGKNKPVVEREITIEIK